MADRVPENSKKDECFAALERVHDFLNNELLEADADLIRHHLHACEDCMEQYEIESTILAMIKRVGSVKAPESLSVRIARICVDSQ